MATIRHPALDLADEASREMDMQRAALIAISRYANFGDPITRVDARRVLDLIADLRRAASAAGWLDEHEAADTGEAA